MSRADTVIVLDFDITNKFLSVYIDFFWAAL
jgi:hypothetical protein